MQLDILDDTRIHNESYSLARKMAADALDVEVPPDELETSSEIVEQLFDRNEPQLCEIRQYFNCGLARVWRTDERSGGVGSGCRL